MNFNIFQYIVPTYILYSYFIQKPKINKVVSGFICIIVVVITAQLNLNYREALQTFLIFMVFFVSTYWQYRNVSISTIYSALPLIIYYIATESMSYVQLPHFWMTIIITLAFISILTFLTRQLIKWFYRYYINAKTFIYIIILCIFFVVYYAQLMNLFEYFLLNDSMLTIFRSVYLFASVLFVLVLIFFHNSSEQIRMIEQEKAQEEVNQQYNQLITRQYDDVRQFRHDYQNILLSLDGFIKAEEWDQLRDYFERVLDKHDIQTDDINRQLGKLIYLQNADLRNLIYTKLLYAKSRGIVVNIEVSESMFIETDETLSLPRMLGIILDNAIEEAAEIQHGELSVSLIQEELESLIIVENSCRVNIESLVTLKENGYSTKGAERGIGLFNLDRLVDKSMILLNTQINDQVFTQELIIPREVI